MTDPISKYQNYVTDAEEQQLFRIFCDCGGNISETGRRGNRNRSTVLRLAKKRQWHRKRKQMKGRVYEKEQTQIIREERKNLRIIRGILGKVLKRLADRLDKDIYDVSVNELIQLIKLEMEMSGERPIEGTGTNVLNVLNALPVKDDERAQLRRNLAVYFSDGSRF